MSKRKQNLGAVYITARLEDSLSSVSLCALTVVEAPMGYGKTTAVSWFLGERVTREDALVIRTSVYSDNLAIFWRSLQDAFFRAGLEFLREYPRPVDAASASLLSDDLCRELASRGDCYVFMDDFHLLSDVRAASFVCALAHRLPSNVHLIVAGRGRFVPAEEVVRLGARVCRIGAQQLRLSRTELACYARRSGVSLTEEQVEELAYSSEGWFSAIYLSLRMFSERGSLPDCDSGIYAMLTSAVIDTLSAQQREFCAVMGLADEFTVGMARFVTENEDAEGVVASLMQQNAFVKRLPDGETFRFHHMMKECSKHVFATLDATDQVAYLDRFGIWYEARGLYLHAMFAYRRNANYDALLRVVCSDAGILLASLKPEDVLKVLDACPASVLKNHPLAILVLMRSMFNWRLIPRLFELKALLEASVEEHSEMPFEERGNLLGELDLVMSFLEYNDIAAMSRLHRSASSQMSRLAVSIRADGGWTFGSPSVLMMFHREPGHLADELASMDECMPCYYRVTGGHGRGAEKIMRAEALFAQGRFADAHIELEGAYAQAEAGSQENMALCCDFLAWRLSLCAEADMRCTLEQRRALLLRQHNAAWVNLLDSVSAYYHALANEQEKIPVLFAEHRLSTVNFLAPGKPMMDMIESQVYLAQGAYAKVIGRSEVLLSSCAALHYGLVALHVRIQVVSAYEMLGRREQARELLGEAFAEAQPDGLLLPFAENYRYIKELLRSCEDGPYTDFVRDVARIGALREGRIAALRGSVALPEAFAKLTARELEVAELAAQRLSNREIAERLYLSEGSVKQYINQVYAKLHIDGNTRVKRKQLIDLAAEMRSLR